LKLLILLVLILPWHVKAELREGFSSKSSTEIISSLWKDYSEQNLDPFSFYQLTALVVPGELTSIEQLLMQQMERSFSKAINSKPLFIKNLSSAEALRLFSESLLIESQLYQLSEQASVSLEQAKAKIDQLKKYNPISHAEIRSLVLKTPDGAYYENGAYKDTIRLFLFCREDRSYPCLFIMKDIFGQLVREDTILWTLPALAKSARNIVYNQVNGETPTGIHLIDSVMPIADKPLVYGKFRRMILNWLPKDKDGGKEMALHFLPSNLKNSKWWKRSSIARDVGRKYLRIHGTGRVNTQPHISYYPLTPTQGCISMREGNYFSKDFRDQRNILDQALKSSRLLPVYNNEPHLKGVLYVINIDKQKKSVTPETLKSIGVL
jgi:hypothetical protein